jgi:hypothetical protein
LSFPSPAPGASCGKIEKQTGIRTGFNDSETIRSVSIFLPESGLELFASHNSDPRLYRPTYSEAEQLFVGAEE